MLPVLPVLRQRRIGWMLAFTLGVMFLLAATASAAGGDLPLKLKTVEFIPPRLTSELAAQLVGTSEGPRLYLVQLNGPVRAEWKQALQNSGGALGDYIPENAFLVRMDRKTLLKIQRLSFLRSIVEYRPEYKLDPNLRDLETAAETSADVRVTVRVNLFAANDRTATADHLVSLGATLDETELQTVQVQGPARVGAFPGHITATVKPQRLETIASWPEVVFIERYQPFSLFNDVAAAIIDVPPIWNAGFHGEGEVVGIADTGLDTGVNDAGLNRDFQGRVQALIALGRPNDASDPHGHGTHVAGSVLGDGANSGGQIRGMAPAARLVFQSIMDPAGRLGGIPDDLNVLFQQAWDAGARIHTNSWGANTFGEYTTASRQVDEFVWNHAMTILFAAGNSGPTGGTIGSPASAKNAITVGASENDRPTKGSTSDNPDEIAYFSSRGPTQDGRLKPDVVAPGTWVLSAKSSLAPNSNFREVLNPYYAYMSGTSMATPITAGAATLAREFLTNRLGSPPSPALVKAALINGATILQGGAPDYSQGRGRIDLAGSLIPTLPRRVSFTEPPAFFEPGQTERLAYTVVDASQPMRFTLVWSDYPGSVAAGKALVNDIDLVVVGPSGQRFFGNDFVSPYDDQKDATNNVEEVFVNAPEVGTYTVTLIAANVPQGPQRGALAVSGGISEQPPAPPGDTVPPTVAITSPANGATVVGTQTVAVDATDAGGVAQTELYVDQTMIGVDAAAPYEFAWNTSGTPNGEHVLTARAFDLAGNGAASAPVTVTVNNPPPPPPPPPPDRQPPVVTVTEPADGAVVHGIVPVRATATDNVGVTQVKFYVDYGLRYTDNTPPWEFSWDTTSGPDMERTIRARAYDAAGNWAYSPTIWVTVQNSAPPDTQPPTVAVTSPSPGAVVQGTISLAATASDNVGVTRVRLRLDGSTLAELTAPPYQIAWDSNTVPNGTHVLDTEAEDAAGNVGQSAPVSFSVANPDLTMPKVEIVSPADGGSVSGTVTLDVSATDNVAVTGLELWIDGVQRGSYAPGAPILWNTTTYANGPHELIVRAYDAAGNVGTGLVRLVVTN